MTVRTRFAPSPTGMLHIGGARTALFNYLYSRHHHGEFLLRIEDTDKERSTQAATQAILDGLAWLGLETDATPVYQSTRAARHAEVAHQMLAAGTAYRCWLTADELKALREAHPGAKIRSPWRDRDPAAGPNHTPPAIRLRAPQSGETTVADLVQGDVRVGNAELDDMIILRSDGTPTYQHAVVVDDHDMAITHVIRGDDHLTNTFRQAQIYDAMGWPRPHFAHVPLIHGADGHKLSKRHGAVSVMEFDTQGYLPEALCNYLMRLGWSHGDLEVISRDEAIRLFDITDVNRGASRMDYAKLNNLNGIWIRAADDARLTTMVLARLATSQNLDLAAGAPRIAALMPELKQRAKTIPELANAATFLACTIPLPLDPKAEAALDPLARALLRALHPILATTDFTHAAIDATLRGFAAAQGKKLGQIAQPLRIALTGTTVSPGIDATLLALGRPESLARIAAVATP